MESLFFPAGAPRRNPAWTSIDLRTSNGHSTYNSLQAMVQKRFSKGNQVQFSYTLSKTMDNTQAQLGVDSVNTSVYPANPYDPDADWSAAAFDIRHVFSANGTYVIPAYKDNALFKGWQINSIVSLRSGLPFSPTIATSNWSRDGNTRVRTGPTWRRGPTRARSSPGIRTTGSTPVSSPCRRRARWATPARLPARTGLSPTSICRSSRTRG